MNLVQSKVPEHSSHSDESYIQQPVLPNGESEIINLPKHLLGLYNSSCEGLDEQQCLNLKQLLYSYSDVFAKDDMDLGCLQGIYHRIDTGDATPVNEKMRRTPIGFQDLERDHIQKLLDANIIQPSASEWAAAPVLVRKKCGAVRYCLDYRKLNGVTIKDRFPLPNINDCLDTLQGNTLFSTLDLAMGYYQIMIHPDSQNKTAFITKYGQFSHTRMGMGLCNAPATFQRAIQLVLRGILWEEVLAYLDDIIVLGKNFDESLVNLKKVLERFRFHNLKLKPSKCILLRKQVQFLGKVVTENGITIAPSKLEAVQSWPVPKNQTELQSFLGFVNYHRDHIRNFAQIASPLYDLSTKKGEITLSDEHLEAFNTLKQAVTSAGCLSFPTPDGLFILDTDASSLALGAVLSQVQDGVVKPICYASNTLLKTQRNYCTTRKELLSVVKFCRQFRHYLLGRRFLLRTDHNSLVWLTRFKDVQGQLARWLEELSQYDIEILHRSGKDHINCDALSRLPDTLAPCDCYQAGKSLQTLPCGGCAFCTRAHNQWGRFCEDVDDVIPLAVRSVTTRSSPQSPDDNDDNPDDVDMPTSTDTSGPNVPLNDAPSAANWLETFSPIELRDIQSQDPDIAPIVQWLHSDIEPSIRQLRLTSPATRAYWLCRSNLQFINGVLYYQWEEGGSSSARHALLLVPEGLRNQVLFHCHDARHAGHFGIQKTVKRLKQSFYWYGMSRDGKEYVKSCLACNKNKKANKNPKAPLRAFHAGFPMERIHMDILGPFTTSQLGNKYILMVICQFSKWIDIIPISDQTAETVAKEFLARIVSYFGCPLEIFTDQGSNFQSNLFSAFCELLEITRTRTTPYRPCGNGQVERYNRVVLQMVRCYIEGKVKQWDRDLYLLAMALRSTEHRQTGFTPNRLMLGREVLQPVDLLLGLTETQLQRYEPYQWVQHLAKEASRAHHIARENLDASQLRQKRDYDLRLLEHTYEVGDLVYKRDTSTRVGISSKLRAPWAGPYIVIRSTPPLYKIADKGKEYVLHHDRLKLCNDAHIPLCT